MTKNEDILKPFEVIERQTLEVENVVEKNKDFTILFDTSALHPIGHLSKMSPIEGIWGKKRRGAVLPHLGGRLSHSLG